MILESFIEDVVRKEDGDGPKADVVSEVAAGREGVKAADVKRFRVKYTQYGL